MLTAAEANRLAYKDMKASYYYGSTILCWALILVMSIVIQSVTIIFDFASAFAVTALAFVFPAMFYLRASKRFGGGTKGYERACYFYFVLGVCNCILGCTSTVLGIIGDE
jgi:cobalamin synthase